MSEKLVICIGAALIDEIYITKDKPICGTSNPAMRQQSPGGVARNIAQHLAQLGNHVELISHFGDDVQGNYLLEHCKRMNIGVSHSKISNSLTGHYTAIHSPDGELFLGASSMNLDSELDLNFFESQKT